MTDVLEELAKGMGWYDVPPKAFTREELDRFAAEFGGSGDRKDGLLLPLIAPGKGGPALPDGFAVIPAEEAFVNVPKIDAVRSPNWFPQGYVVAITGLFHHEEPEQHLALDAHELIGVLKPGVHYGIIDEAPYGNLSSVKIAGYRQIREVGETVH